MDSTKAHKIMSSSTLSRRVSFSDRISYSDEASTTTVTTDDEMYRDIDGAFLSEDSDDESLGEVESSKNREKTLNDDVDKEEARNSEDKEEIDPIVPEKGNVPTEKEEFLGQVESKKKEKTLEESDKGVRSSDKEEIESIVPEKESDAKEKEDKPCDESWDHLQVREEPPLQFRDTGVVHRPTDYLGGYGPEMSCSSPHRVKMRKSWVADAMTEEDQEHSDYLEFEAWKKARAEAALGKKKKETKETKPDDIVEVSKAGTPEQGNEIEKASEVIDEPKPGNNIIPHTGEMKLESEPPRTLATTSDQPKSVVKKSSETGDKVKRKSILMKSNQQRVSKPKQPAPKDPETRAHEKQVLELKEHIAKLQRELDVNEVRTISQLADLEEETTKRMREYRAKADEIIRKQRAKNEKQALKQKAMMSQDIIEDLRRSNQKLRAEGVKMRDAVAKLKKSNQTLEEKNSFHRDYAAEFLNFQEVEVGLAEAMNQSLKNDIPKYEKLIRGMEDGVVDRAKTSQVERNSRELYEGCIESLVEMLEENCGDSNLMDRVTCLMNDETDEGTIMGQSDRATTRSLDRKTAFPALKKNTPNRRSSKTDMMEKETRIMPSRSLRRSSSTGGKMGSSKHETKKRRSSSRNSFRKSKTATSDDDDSSTASITSVNSDTTFSISGYAIDTY